MCASDHSLLMIAHARVRTREEKAILCNAKKNSLTQNENELKIYTSSFTYTLEYIIKMLRTFTRKNRI